MLDFTGTVGAGNLLALWIMPIVFLKSATLNGALEVVLASAVDGSGAVVEATDDAAEDDESNKAPSAAASTLSSVLRLNFCTELSKGVQLANENTLLKKKLKTLKKSKVCKTLSCHQIP